MDAPQDFNPYLNLSEQEKDNELKNAVIFGDFEKTDFLIKAGANIKQTSDFIPSLLNIAIANGYRKVAELLIANGLNDIEGISPESSDKTLLMIAAEQNHVQIVDLLIQMGAQTNRIDTLGETALVKSAFGRVQSAHFYEACDTTYRLLCELNSEELDAYAKESPKHKGAVKQVEKTRDRIRQAIMPFALNIKGAHGYDKLLPEILNIISRFVFKLQKDERSLPVWCTPCVVEHEIRNFMDTLIPKKIKEALKPAPTVTPLRDAKDKKRKAEDDLDEKGRNKRMRVETQDEQEQEMNPEQSYFSASNYCTQQ